jgi:hypothetical protein
MKAKQFNPKTLAPGLIAGKTTNPQKKKQNFLSALVVSSTTSKLLRLSSTNSIPFFGLKENP